MLSETDIRQFNEQGFLVVRDCVPVACAREASEAIWADLMARHDVTEDPGTWHGQYMNFGATALKGGTRCSPSRCAGSSTTSSASVDGGAITEARAAARCLRHSRVTARTTRGS